MINTQFFLNLLNELGIEFFTGVPDSLLKDICACIKNNTTPKQNIIAANEGSAIGLAAGYHLATKKIPLVYLQNSGIGNAINPLLSLADKDVYQIPLLLMIGWRGEPGIKDEPQHIKQGKVTLELLKAMELPYIVLDYNFDEAKKQIIDIIKSIKNTGIPHAIVVRKSSFSKFSSEINIDTNLQLSREDAMKVIVDNLDQEDIVISTTGKLSRELYEYREESKQGHKKDFLTVGSMGHAAAIALGVALNKPERTVFCFDGDGSVIMHAGILSSIGTLAPKNFKHIVFNNGAHESVGGQPTTGFAISISDMALASKYKNVFCIDSLNNLNKILLEIKQMKGPILLEIKVNLKSRENLGRPHATPKENKKSFIQFIQ